MYGSARAARLVLASTFFACAAVGARAQCREWSPGFGTGGPNNHVYAQAIYDDGNGPALYAGGAFSSAGSVLAGSIARWDGATWSALGAGTNGTVESLCVFDDGSGPSLYAGGNFTTMDGIAVNHIARWNGVAWSALDSGVTNFSGSPTRVRDLEVFDDGSGYGLALYVCGEFVVAGGQSVSYVARWNGTSWGAMPGFSTFANALTIHDDGLGGGPALYAGGQFTGGVKRWDGASWSTVGGGVQTNLGIGVAALTSFDDGAGPTLFAGGNFHVAGGVPTSGIARFTGGSWSAVSGGVTTDCCDGNVSGMTVFDDGPGGNGPALFVTGNFTSAGGAGATRIAKWDGTAWSALAGGLSSFGMSLIGFDDGSGAALFAGGVFETAGGVGASYIARWTSGLWSALGSGHGLSDVVYVLASLDTGSGPSLYAGGTFESAGGVAASRVARWDGSGWSALGHGVTGHSGLFAAVTSLATYDDGGGLALYVGGDFDTAGGVPASCIAKWDGSSWSQLTAGMSGNPSNTVRALAAYDDGLGGGPLLYAAGDFWIAGAVYSEHLARWDGSNWLPVSTGVNGYQVLALQVSAVGGRSALVVGGNFTVAGGTSAINIASWDGTSFSPLSSGTNLPVRALCVFDDGSGPALFAGGEFTSAGGVPANHIAKWNGTSWSALDTGTDGTVYALAVHDDGTGPALYVAGGFQIAGGLVADHIARWKASGWSDLGHAIGGTSQQPVYTLASSQDCGACAPALYAGGYFATAAGEPSSRIARWGACPTTGTPFCFGDGSLATACPCANFGAVGHGCRNSRVGNQGATLEATGTTSPDTLVLHAAQVLPNALSIFLQGNAELTNGVVFGDGVRCVGGSLKRIAVENAVLGHVSYPNPGDPSISAKSAALGDPIPPGGVRYYQTYYRDPDLTFCPAPQGNTWNVTGGVRITW